MIHSKAQTKRLTAGRRSLLLLAVLSLVISLLSLPLYAKTVATNSPAGRMVDDIKNGARDLGRGARNFGRDVRDAVDPNGDGILPDGSIDNGIANDGNQFDTSHPNGTMTDLPQTSDGALNEVRPDTPATDGSRPSPDDSNGNITGNQNGNVTDHMNGTSDGANTTDTPDDNTHNGNTNGAGNNANGDTANGNNANGNNANGNNANGENTDDKTEGGFRWTGLIVAIVIAVAVIVLICLLIPRKKKN